MAPPPPDDRPYVERRGISPVTFGGLSIGVIFLLYGVVGSLIAAVIFVLDPGANTPGGVRLFTGVGQILLLLLPALVLSRLASRDLRGFLRIRRPPWRAVLASFVGVLSLQTLLQVYLVVQSAIPLPPEIQALVTKMKESLEAALLALLRADSFMEFLAVALVIAAIPAVVEELVFRGLIQRSFERGVGPVRAFIITGVVFGAFHLNPFSIVPLMALGVYLGFVAWRADSVWASACAHFFNNMIPVTAAYIGMNDDVMVKGDLGDLPAGTLAALAWFSGVIFLLSTYYLLHVTRQTGSPAGGHAASERP